MNALVRLLRLLALLGGVAGARRGLVRLLAGVGGSLQLLCSPVPALAEPRADFGVLNGRLRTCPQQGNCISTAAVSSLEKYGRPWVFSGGADEAWAALRRELAANKLLTVVEANDETKYAHATAKSAVPPTGLDDLEFLVLPEEGLITYRSNSRELVRVGGGVVGDGGSHLNRLQSIRTHLGLREMGSDGFEEAGPGRTSFLDKLRSGFGYTANGASEVNFLDNSVPSPAEETGIEE